jgi:hypothetical protein
VFGWSDSKGSVDILRVTTTTHHHNFTPLQNNFNTNPTT